MDHSVWQYLAEEDLHSVRNNLNADYQPWSVIASNAHQAAEKYLKAFLAFKGVEPPRSHDLQSLLQIAQGYDPSLSSLRDSCALLSVHAIQSRYPEDENEYDKRVTLEAVDYSNSICEAIRERIS